MYYCRGRAVPLWEGGNLVSERSIVDLVNQDPEEGGRLFAGIILKLRVDFNDERRCDGREQTGLEPRISTGRSELDAELTKIKVVFKSSSYFFMNSLSYSSATFR